MRLTIQDQTFVGTPEKVITCLEAAGYQAQRNNDNPHFFWQYSEFIKRENLHGNDRRADMVQLRKPRSYRKDKN